MNWLNKVFHIPTFSLMVISRPLMPEDHPFKCDDIGLTQWTRRSTDITKMFNVIFWYHLCTATAMVHLILTTR